eukprot:1157541-Pelagomonas_calceolata.AAC.5
MQRISSHKAVLLLRLRPRGVQQASSTSESHTSISLTSVAMMGGGCLLKQLSAVSSIDCAAPYRAQVDCRQSKHMPQIPCRDM